MVRLAGRAFAAVEALDGHRVRTGAGALDAQLARAAARAGIAGLEFFTGVPGTVGGACVMNAGCYGAETRDVLVEAHALTRAGEHIVLSNAGMDFGYRRCGAAADRWLLFTAAVFRGTPDDPTAVATRMDAITARREASQPIREKTGGSTFKNPDGHSAWKLVDAAGWRGRVPRRRDVLPPTRQLPHQHRLRQRGGPGRPGRSGARGRGDTAWGGAAVGGEADRARVEGADPGQR